MNNQYDDALNKYASCKHENESLKWQIANLIERNSIMLSLIRSGKVRIKVWINNCDGVQVNSTKEFTTLEAFDHWLIGMQENTTLPFGYEVEENNFGGVQI